MHDVRLFEPFQQRVLYESVAVDSAGGIWFGTDRAGAYHYDGTQWTKQDTSNGLCAHTVTAIAVGGADTVWFGSAHNGVCVYDGGGYSTFDTGDGLAGNEIEVIAFDRRRNVWVGCPGHGVSRFNGTSWTTFDTTDGIAGTDIRAIAAGRGDSVWIGTWGDGVSVYDGNTWTTYTEEDGLASNEVVAIMVDSDGTVQMGTEGGVCSLDGQQWDTLTSRNSGLPCTAIIEMDRDSRGTLWVGIAACGVASYDGTKWITYNNTNGLRDNLTKLMVVDREDNVWCVTSQYEVITKIIPDRSGLLHTADSHPASGNSISVHPVYDHVYTVRGLPRNGTQWRVSVFASDGRCVFDRTYAADAAAAITLARDAAGIFSVVVRGDGESFARRMVVK
jgi:ligand-binding sensor domain-containing protein